MLLTLYAVVPTLYSVNITLCYVLFKVSGVIIFIMVMIIVQILWPVLPAFCLVAYATRDDVQIILYAVLYSL